MKKKRRDNDRSSTMVAIFCICLTAHGLPPLGMHRSNKNKTFRYTDDGRMCSGRANGVEVKAKPNL